MECQALDEVIGWKVVVARGHTEREREKEVIYTLNLCVFAFDISLF